MLMEPGAKMRDKTKDTVLIVATGAQDIKILCLEQDSNTVKPCGLGRRHSREFHQALVDGDIPWRMVATEQQVYELTGKEYALNTEARSGFIDIEEDSGPDRNKILKLVGKGKVEVEALTTNDDGTYLLFPGKLHSVIEAIDKTRIKTVLVFYSDRKKSGEDCQKNNHENYSEEPIATGKILAQWLAQQCGFADDRIAEQAGHDFTRYQSCHVNMLDGLYIFEGNKLFEKGVVGVEDQPVAYRCSQIIDRALHAMAEANPGCTAIVSATGGIADAKPVISNSARLHFRGRLQEVYENEYAQNLHLMGSSDEVSVHIAARHEALDARYHATRRLWEGDFGGAWAVVSHIALADPQLQKDSWIEPIRQAANFMEGWEAADFDRLGFEPIPQTIDKALREQILLAWQVEASLQHDQGKPWVNHMLRHCLNLLENLLHQQLKQFYQNRPDGFEICLDNKGEISKIEDKPRPGRDDFMACLEKYFDDEPIVKPLQNLHTLLTKIRIKKNGKPLVSFRNDVAHRSLSHEHIEDILSYGNNQELWNVQPNGQQENKLGTVFLSSTVMQTVFAQLLPENIAPVDQLYRQFVQRLLDTTYQPL